MPLPLKAEAAATRYAPYVEELQEFFAGRRLQFGHPDDVTALGQRLSIAGFFREEMSSMVRAIIYREREGISRPELLEIIVTAIGGTRIRADAPALAVPLAQITEFLNHVLTSLWRRFPDEMDAEPAHPAPVAIDDRPRHSPEIAPREITSRPFIPPASEPEPNLEPAPGKIRSFWIRSQSPFPSSHPAATGSSLAHCLSRRSPSLRSPTKTGGLLGAQSSGLPSSASSWPSSPACCSGIVHPRRARLPFKISRRSATRSPRLTSTIPRHRCPTPRP